MDVIIPDSHKFRYEINNGVVKIPNEILCTKAEEVEKVDENIAKLVARMMFLMVQNRGIGIAANQIGVSKRIIIVQSNEQKVPVILINPVVLEESSATVTSSEGCLSIPGLYGNCKRNASVTYEYLNLQGQKQQEKFTGIAAWVAQHELDHLNGILFVDRAIPETLSWK